MTVETHLYVCVHEDGRPVRAYRDRDAAYEARASDSYSVAEIVDVYPDVPLMEAEA